jgi:hypothetical protein
MAMLIASNDEQNSQNYENKAERRQSKFTNSQEVSDKITLD